MSIPRRALLWRLGSGRRASGVQALVAARGREAAEGEFGYGASLSGLMPPVPGKIRLDSNENPTGPCQAAVAAMLGEFPQVMRYPFNSRPADADLRALIAQRFSVKPENVVLGAGSGEVLRNASRAFTTTTRHLVTASPTFKVCEDTARQIGHPVTAVPLDGELKLDLDAMADAAQGAGLVFLCNPNNPSATVHGAKAVAAFVARVKKASPETAILVDEAYHEYVGDPDYATAAPLALEYPGVFITRTFSKAYGMAGLRVGYAVGRADTIKALARYSLTYNMNVFAMAAAVASLDDPAAISRERSRNDEARKFTLDFFTRSGFKPTDSHTNFVFVDLRTPARTFREACAGHGVQVGRNFPPLDHAYSRISIGTMDEMRRATTVFARVLGASTTSAAR